MPFRCVCSVSNCRLESLKCKVSQALPGAVPQLFLALKARPQTILFWPQKIHISLTSWSYYSVIASDEPSLTLHKAPVNLCGKGMNIWASTGSVTRFYSRVTFPLISKGVGYTETQSDLFFPPDNNKSVSIFTDHRTKINRVKLWTEPRNYE